jgi:predicted peptidase
MFKHISEMKAMTVLLTALSVFSCAKDSNTCLTESLDKINGSNFEYNSTDDYFFGKPLNYNDPNNSLTKYPLVVYLHGSGGAGSINNLNYLGYDTNDGKDDQKAKEFQINHPSFVLVPQTTAGAWDGKKVATLIEGIKKQYRIDISRIYLIGYSMGGSGSYIVANACFDYYKQLFAGIIRLAGQSQAEVRSEIAKNTAIWLHIGLDDTNLRISVTRDAYKFLKNIHADVSETSKVITLAGYTGTTLALLKSNKEIVKKTEYNNVGHGISTFPFNDSNLIEWLYFQRIE